METEQNELKFFEEAERNKEYFDNNFQTLEINYPEHFVAISGATLVGTSKDVDSLIDLVESKDINKNNVLIEFIPEAGTILVL